MNTRYDTKKLAACGEDVVIHADVEIKRAHKVRIGSHVAIDKGFYCTVGADIGDYVHIGPYVTAIGGEDGHLTLNHFATIAAGSRIVTVGDEHTGHGLVGPTIPPEFRDKLIVGPVILEMFANVGTNAVILPGITLSEECVIAACSLVAQSTQPWTVYAGVPARPVRERPRDRILEMARKMGYR